MAEYLKRRGYRIFPVNPKESVILGEKAYASLADVPEPVDIVNVFRRSDAVPEIVTAAIAIGAKAVWLQEEVQHDEAAAQAAAAGLAVAQDLCILKVHRTLTRS